MPPVFLSKRDDCAIRHDRPTFNTFDGLHPKSSTVTFETFRAMAPPSVPEAFLRKRYDDVPIDAVREEFEYAAKLATADFGYRNHVSTRYEKLRTGVPSKRNVSTHTEHERRAGADKEDDDNDSMLPRMD